MKEIAVNAPRVTYYQGGAERYILNSLIEISKRRKITLISYDSPKKTEWFTNFLQNFKGEVYLLKSKKMDENFKIFERASSPRIWDKESKIFCKEISNFYKKENFDYVVCHYNVDCLYLPKNQNLILHLHGLPDRRRKIESKAILIPKKIISVSKYVKKGWKNLHGINKNISVVQNGIEIIKQIDPKNREEDLICFGRLIKIKGVEVLLRAIKILNDKNIFPKLNIIGEGPKREKLRKLSKKLNLKKVNFLGRISDERLYSIVGSSKISVFPSYKREGIMTTLLEASKYGSAIIASDSCSNREFLKNNYNGILFRERNEKDLAEKIEELLINEKLRKKLTKNSLRTLKDFTWQKQAKKIEEIYY